MACFEAGQAFFNISNLSLLDTTREIVMLANRFLQKYSLDPRDAIHAATAFHNGIRVIISEDKDFDKVSEFKRISLSQLHNI